MESDQDSAKASRPSCSVIDRPGLKGEQPKKGLKVEGDCKPVKTPPCRVPPYQREVINQQLGELLTTGRIEPFRSPWSSPVVLARKHEGTYRMCIDYRKQNQLTQKDAIPLPRTDDVLGALGGAQWFSSLHLASGYWQMQVKEEDNSSGGSCPSD